MNNYIGIDLGGTTLRVARINDDLVIEDVIKVDSEVEKGSEQIIDKICNSINEIKNEQTVGVGLSVPGQVDVDNKVIIATTNIPFDNDPIGNIIKERCNLDVVLNNDANVAGLAEAAVGAAKDSDLVYFITWSTGIGGALIINKSIVNGRNMYTGEIGNLIIHSNSDYKHSIMTPGGLEGLTSGTALKRYAVEHGFGDVKSLVDSYKQNDSKAIEIINYVADNFARAIAAIYHVVEVEKFVIGGGVTIKSGDVLLPIVKKQLNNYLMPVVHDKVNIATAELGDDAGIYGSAFLAKDQL